MVKSKDVSPTAPWSSRTAIEAAWLSPGEACIYLGVSTNHLYTKVMDHVETRKVGHRTLMKRSSLDAFMEQQPLQPKEGLRVRRGKQAKGN
jgi:excisionase family DNA binding protein